MCGCASPKTPETQPQVATCGFFVETPAIPKQNSMIIVLRPNISKKDEAAVLKEIRKLGYKPHVMRGVARTVVGAIGDELSHKSLDSPAEQLSDDC